jgi:hypothetical protein
VTRIVGILLALVCFSGQRRAVTYLWYVGLLWLAVPFMCNAQAPVLFGNDSVGFVFDSTMRKKVVPSMPWIFEVRPKPIVLEWWFAISSCEKLLPGDAFGRIKFFIVNQDSFGIDSDTDKYGAYYGYTLNLPDGTYAIFLAASIADSRKVSTHEMTHVLMAEHHEKPGHPPRRFQICGLADSDPL